MRTIRRIKAGEETELSALIRRCFWEINTRDYSKEALQYWNDYYTPEHVREIAETSHTYVMEEDGVLLGTCSVLWKTEDPETEEEKTGGAGEGAVLPKEAFIEALYVIPDHAREGIASEMLAVCENDPDFAEAVRFWVDSSITARTFYEKHGYLHETGEPVCIENDRYIMYKPR